MKFLIMHSMNDTIRKYRQDWLERVEMMEGGRGPKQAFVYKPRGRRDPGRRWKLKKPE
jgi:hypothetical protein